VKRIHRISKVVDTLRLIHLTVAGNAIKLSSSYGVGVQTFRFGPD